MGGFWTAALIAVAVGLILLWLALLVTLAITRPADLRVTDVLRLLPDTVVLLRRLSTDPDPPVYGARKLWKADSRAGHDIGRDQVAGTCGPPASPEPAAANESGPPNPTPPRRAIPIWWVVTATAPNQLWVTDLTFVPTWGRCDLRLLHHRRVQSDHRRLARRCPHAHHDGA